jgi:hypothetical protein
MQLLIKYKNYSVFDFFQKIRRWSKEVYYIFGFLVIVIISLLIALVVIASTDRNGKIYLISIIDTQTMSSHVDLALKIFEI